MIFFRKNILFLVLLSFIYFFYVNFFLHPNLYRNFSLIDDGQMLQNSIFFSKCFSNGDCTDLRTVLVEKEFGRFRPLYWFINYVLYLIFGMKAVMYHQFRINFLGLVLFYLVVFSIVLSGGRKFGALIGGMLFLSSYSFTENLIRLGPVEPYQAIFTFIFLVIFLKKRWAFWPILLFLYTASFLVKETSVVLVLPVLIMSFFFSRDKRDRRYALFFSVFAIFLLILSRKISSPVSDKLAYVDNFKFDIYLIVSNITGYSRMFLNATQPFVKLFLIVFLIILMLFRNSMRLFIKESYLLWLVVLFSFMIILLPWQYVLERYIFISISSFSIFIGIFISDLQRILFDYIKKTRVKVILYLLFVVAVFNVFFYNFPLNLAKSINYVSWYSNFLDFEKDQVEAIADTRAPLVTINAKDTLDNWEVLYEIPLHLRYIYGSQVAINRADAIPTSGYIFMRNSLASSFSEDEILGAGFKLVDSKQYKINVIDPIAFREGFRYKPLSTLVHPTLSDQEITYIWKIFKK